MYLRAQPVLGRHVAVLPELQRVLSLQLRALSNIHSAHEGAYSSGEASK